MSLLRINKENMNVNSKINAEKNAKVGITGEDTYLNIKSNTQLTIIIALENGDEYTVDCRDMLAAVENAINCK